MAKKKSTLERVRANPRNVVARDLQELLVDFGFELRDVSGDHFVYKRAGYRPIPVPIRQNPIAFYIVKEILKVIESIENQAIED